MGKYLLLLSEKRPEEEIKSGKKFIANFFNMNSLFWYCKNEMYRKIVSRECNRIFPDGKLISVFSGLKQVRGPQFTKRFLMNEYVLKKKHFFVGLDKINLKKLASIVGIDEKKISGYNPPFIDGLKFSEEENSNILNLIKRFMPDFVWTCVGGTKQDFLSNMLFEKYPTIYLNVGAGMDFFLGKKSEAPLIFRKIGFEWLYRLVKDFRLSRVKVWRSFLALGYLVSWKVKLGAAK